jgi:hypothetical protein
MRQTMSVLAGQSGTDRWVMTAALLVVGSSQIATGAGLTGVRMPARILLVLTGLSTLGIAATPEPAAGPTPRHLAFAVSCVVTTAVWPVLVAGSAPARSWILSIYSCATVTVVFAGLSCWLLIAARDGGGDLGMAERLTSAVQGLFPLVVALALRQTTRDAGSSPSTSQATRSSTSGQYATPTSSGLGQPADRRLRTIGSAASLQRCRSLRSADSRAVGDVNKSMMWLEAPSSLEEASYALSREPNEDASRVTCPCRAITAWRAGGNRTGPCR